jgi:outer membrane protein OmpA-like peptidoglycan-associated protein
MPLKTPRLLLFAASLLFALPALAQADGPAAWIAPGGGVAWIPAELGVKDHRPTFGGIFGLRLSSCLALEARGHYTTADGDVPATPKLKLTHGEGNLTLFLTHSAVRPYLTAGAGAVRLDQGTKKDKFAANAGLGLSIRLSDYVGLRLDGRDISYKLVGSNGDKYRHAPEIFGGLSFGFGGKPKDSDQDGVIDKLDGCPSTPAGARVDSKGCPLDGDGDGVYDGLDRCEGTPKGATVDASGCPTDSDKDGVFDGIDHCADTPAGARVDPQGCPSDSDGDGVPDGIDQCEATPKGCTVNANGCPSDEDQDGVCDGLDQCADTPANVRVDKNGCPIVVSQKETELLETGMIRLQNVNFDTGKAIIKPESFAALDEVGNILARWPELRIQIAGHTDSRGSDARNQDLSEARAKAVLDYLTSKFPELNANQFTAVGYGESQPIADNKSVLGMAKNRRVEFRVLNTEVLRREKESKKLAPKE